jgi:hypothetical protein
MNPAIVSALVRERQRDRDRRLALATVMRSARHDAPRRPGKRRKLFV